MTTNNHPAHGPLSNYRLHRIREILGKAAAQSDGGNIGYAMSDAVKAFDELLASRGSKPVYQYQSGIYNEDNGETDWYWDDCDIGFYEQYAAGRRRILYTAPPAPVSVPDESAVELLATDLMKRIDKITGERHSVATLSSLRVSIVEACRAAMLNGGKS
ncbi:hypothetical protein [Citrobacter koseri]|uniref:hypothetical protein n=1 Tax=Citrobacter koseri TaxID=545 RepID=UPI0019078072|nr:hypothetical protein [Citrobacter koseri]MBJ8938542.1 hypothetical protein [Citrobacter koseri]